VHPENLKSLAPKAANLAGTPKGITSPEVVSATLARVSHLESSYARLKFAMEAHQIPKLEKILRTRARESLRQKIKPRTLEFITSAALASAIIGIPMNNSELGRYTRLSPRCIRKWRHLYNSTLDYLYTLEGTALHGISDG